MTRNVFFSIVILVIVIILCFLKFTIDLFSRKKIRPCFPISLNIEFVHYLALQLYC